MGFLISIKRSYLIWLLKQFGVLTKDQMAGEIKEFKLIRESEILKEYSRASEVPPKEIPIVQFGAFLKRGLKLRTRRRAEGTYCYLSSEALSLFNSLLKMMKANDNLVWDGKDLTVEPEFQIGEGKRFEVKEREEGVD